MVVPPSHRRLWPQQRLDRRFEVQKEAFESQAVLSSVQQGNFGGNLVPSQAEALVSVPDWAIISAPTGAIQRRTAQPNIAFGSVIFRLSTPPAPAVDIPDQSRPRSVVHRAGPGNSARRHGPVGENPRESRP